MESTVNLQALSARMEGSNFFGIIFSLFIQQRLKAFLFSSPPQHNRTALQNTFTCAAIE